MCFFVVWCYLLVGVVVVVVVDVVVVFVAVAGCFCCLLVVGVSCCLLQVVVDCFSSGFPGPACLDRPPLYILFLPKQKSASNICFILVVVFCRCLFLVVVVRCWLLLMGVVCRCPGFRPWPAPARSDDVERFLPPDLPKQYLAVFDLSLLLFVGACYWCCPLLFVAVCSRMPLTIDAGCCFVFPTPARTRLPQLYKAAFVPSSISERHLFILNIPLLLSVVC